MTLPLYEAAAQQPVRREREGHAGLWFDKFCDEWRVNGSTWTMKDEGENNPKRKWINSLADDPIGTRGQIEECALRLTRLVERRGGRSAVFTAQSRFVTGLGRSHPVENGFAWHPTLGTPFLPGSSVKGLVRAWTEVEAAPSDREILKRLLGEAGKAGSVCFLDAVPIASVRLEVDIMTPHCAGWSEDDPPGDWRSPTPIPFLVTAARTSFLFGIIPCRAVTDDDLNTVAGWLSSALAWAGGGAKTAIGYGRFDRDDKKTCQWTQRLSAEQARRDAMESPVARWRLKLEGLSEAEVLDLVRIHLEKEPLEDPIERRAFAEAVLSAPTDLVEHWRRGTKQEPRTNVGRKKLRERARLLDNVVLRLART